MANYKNDEDMVYSLSKHRYIITPQAMEDDYGINLVDSLNAAGDANPDTLPDRFLNRVSMAVYNYIYSWSSNKDDTEYEISKDKYRDAIREAQEELAYSWLMNNTDPNIIFKDGLNREFIIGSSAHTILLNNGLLFRGKITALPSEYRDRKGKDY